MNANYQEKKINDNSIWTKQRLMGISFESVAVEIEVDDNATPEEIKEKAMEQFLNNFWGLIEGKADCVIMPKDTLNEKAAFIGQLVKITETNQSGVILKINKQNHKCVTVLFPDGTTSIHHYHALKRSYQNINSFSFPLATLKDGEEIKPNVIYKIDTGISQHLAIMTFTNNSKSRVGVNYITNSAKRSVKFMSYDDALHIISNI